MQQHKKLLYSLYFISFISGMALCFEGIFLPEFKTYFSLTYTEQMYTMFSKNIPFLIFSIAIGFYLPKIGYKNCLTIGLFLFSIGTLLVVPGLHAANYAVVLGAFFLIGTGFNFQLVAGNPMLAALGSEKTAASRLNTGNALGAVAQIIAPLFIVLFIPASVVTIESKLPYIKGVFIVTSVVLALVGVASFFIKDTIGVIMTEPRSALNAPDKNLLSIWQTPKVVLGFIAIFLIVGVEAGLFGLYRNYVEDTHTGALTSHESQQMFTVYFALFAAGRITASWVQKKIPAATTMRYGLLISLILIGIIMYAKGWVAVVAITAIGFFISMFFPTVYAMAIEGLGKKTGQASGVLNMGFLGSALLPVLQGSIADKTSLPFSYVIAVLPYLFVLYFVLKGNNLQSFTKHAQQGFFRQKKMQT